MPLMIGDLHIHSYFSDGDYKPQEIIAEAERKGLQAVSLTDHDCVDGLEEFLRAASKSPLKAIPGIELSSVFEDEDIHILGYGIDFRDSQLQSYLVQLRKKREERVVKMLDCLEEKGIRIDVQDVLKEAHMEGAIGRVHIAKVLVKHGFVESISEAFEIWLGRDGLCFEEKYRIDPVDHITTIRELGGIAVLAHPGVYSSRIPLDEFKKAGLRGIEVFHPDHSTEDVERLLAVCEELNLLVTGGSDAHGPQAERGFEIGDVYLGEPYLSRFLEAF